MSADLDYGGSGSSGNGKLRQWLIEQVDCGKYPGLVWENDEKTIFRIPWKHAGKQDYNRDEDAALFKVTPIFQGRTRDFRCASGARTDVPQMFRSTEYSVLNEKVKLIIRIKQPPAHFHHMCSFPHF